MIHPALIEGQHYEPNSSVIDHLAMQESSVDSEANARMKLIAYDYNSSVSTSSVFEFVITAKVRIQINIYFSPIYILKLRETNLFWVESITPRKVGMQDKGAKIQLAQVKSL